MRKEKHAVDKAASFSFCVISDFHREADEN
jgi:hypothetical protein